MQAKDVPDAPVLAFLALHPGQWHNWFGIEKSNLNSVRHAMPAETPEKVVLAKMRALIRRELVSGCDCGCRGDFEITPKGLVLVSAEELAAARESAPAWHSCQSCHRESPWTSCAFCGFKTAIRSAFGVA